PVLSHLRTPPHIPTLSLPDALPISLGFEGYADLRLGIAGETGRAARTGGWTDDIGREIQPTDPLERVLGQIMAADTRAMICPSTDRKSTRLNSSHLGISYAVFCLKK